MKDREAKSVAQLEKEEFYKAKDAAKTEEEKEAELQDGLDAELDRIIKKN